ncbi:hypothetical protein VTL71DRAFT_6006 [Oculimacula yallundae]|uniref:Uncharacterized protein n=1 Tax=Oculimacula yallundae TaxID=86028 RepID=A0ABR4BZ43_9HELO
MASTNPQLPDTKPDNPPTPLPSLSVTQADEIMAPATPQPSAEAPANPFTDPQEDMSLYSITSALQIPAFPAALQYTDIGDALQATDPETGTAVQDFEPTMTGDTLTVGPKSSSSKSTTSTAPSHRTGTTLISSTHGHAMTTPKGTATMNKNPFADPIPHVQVQDEDSPSTPLPRTTPLHTQNHTPGISPQYLHPHSFSPQSSFAPTPPPKLPFRTSNRWTTLSSIGSRIKLPPGLQSHASASASRSNTSLVREALARDSARRQDLLLASERAKLTSYSQADLQEPHLRPSPSALRVAAELMRARDANVNYGAQAVLKSPGFWVAILGAQAGLISMSAAIAVIIEADRRGETAYVGAGRVFWLVVSVIIFLVSAGVVWGFWLRKSGVTGFRGGEDVMLRGLGRDGNGWFDNPVARDVELGGMPIDTSTAPQRGGMASPRESLRNTPRGDVPSAASLSSIRTRDPEWQAMYATPREIWQQVSQESLGDTPVRSGAYGIHKGSDGKRRYDGQRAHPPRKSSISNPGNLATPDKPWEQELQPTQKPAPTLTRSDKSWPLRTSPLAAPFVNTEAEHSPYQSPSPASEHGLLQDQTPLCTQLSPNNPYNTPSPFSTSDPIPIPIPTNTDDNHHHTRAESRVEVLSPLSSLTQSVHSASQASLPHHHRPQYIQAHRVASEERVRSLRESLDSRSRGESFTSSSTQYRDIERVGSNEPLVGARGESLREFLAGSAARHEAGVATKDGAEAGVEDKKERVGRRRSRSVNLDSMEVFPEMGLADGYGGKTHQQRARDVLAGVKGRLHQRQSQPRGRSLGSVVREKMAKLKEAGVDQDSEPTPPMPQMPSPVRNNTNPNANTLPDPDTNPDTNPDLNLTTGPEIFALGNDSPTTSPAPTPTPMKSTPSRIPRKPTPHPALYTSPTKSLLQTPKNNETANPDSVLLSSPLSRKDGYTRLDD